MLFRAFAITAAVSTMLVAAQSPLAVTDWFAKLQTGTIRDGILALRVTSSSMGDSDPEFAFFRQAIAVPLPRPFQEIFRNDRAARALGDSSDFASWFRVKPGLINRQVMALRLPFRKGSTIQFRTPVQWGTAVVEDEQINCYERYSRCDLVAVARTQEQVLLNKSQPEGSSVVAATSLPRCLSPCSTQLVPAIETREVLDAVRKWERENGSRYRDRLSTNRDTPRQSVHSGHFTQPQRPEYFAVLHYDWFEWYALVLSSDLSVKAVVGGPKSPDRRPLQLSGDGIQPINVGHLNGDGLDEIWTFATYSSHASVQLTYWDPANQRFESKYVSERAD